MASIDSFPVDFAIPRKVPAPKVIVSVGPKDRMPPIPTITRAHLTPKERYLIEWLASEDGQSSLSKMPSKAGILAMVRLCSKGLIRVPIEFTEYGLQIHRELTRKEEISSDRVARKAQIRRHEARHGYRKRS